MFYISFQWITKAASAISQFDSCAYYFLYASDSINRVLFAINFSLIIDFKNDSIGPFEFQQE